jgi:hypothetical protein
MEPLTMPEPLPVNVTLHRKNQSPLKTFQTVTVKSKDKVREILAKTTFPKAALVSPETGFRIDPSDYLYRHVKNCDTVEVVE